MISKERYPETWDEFIGQGLAKEQLQDAALTAVVNEESADHVLLASGQEGIGKTALARLFAKELGAGVQVRGGKVLADEDQARLTISCMRDGDVLIIEEIHRLGRRGTEWLLNFLQDGVLMGPLGEEEMPRVTVVATTTEQGALLPTVTSRFMVPPLTAYTTEEAVAVAALRARYHLEERGLPTVSERECRMIAEATSNNPRRIDRLIKLLRNGATSGRIAHDSGGYDMDALFTSAGMTPDGLDLLAQRYLIALATIFGGRVGQAAIANHLRAPGGLAETEYLLQDKGLLILTARGRRISTEGNLRAQALAAAA